MSSPLGKPAPQPCAMDRAAGVLLPIASLPEGHGIGDLGRTAHGFVDLLAAAGHRLWQVLPVGPVGLGNSPYAAQSSFAGEPLLVDLTRLVDAGWLGAEALADPPPTAAESVDYAAVRAFKLPRLRAAAAAFEARARHEDRVAFDEFAHRERGWLEPFSRFAALTAEHGRDWTRWPRTDPDARQVVAHRVVQFFFDAQWNDLRRHACDRGVRLLGDLPIFVDHCSADVWSRPDLFDLDEDGRPNAVSGVPPDYFSATGQRWNNPLYRWDAVADDGYAYWIDRLRGALRRCDAIRLDHFRGFEAYWEIPMEAEDARAGAWRPGPGAALFEALIAALGPLALFAEDLGEITPEVLALRDQFGLPGMRVFQFGFDSGRRDDPFLPAQYPEHCVAYTATHDNDTMVGWASTGAVAVKRALKHLHCTTDELPAKAVDAVYGSRANWAVAPLQDLLGSGGRVNTPGVAEGNWQWRVAAGQLGPAVLPRLGAVVERNGR